MSGGWVTPLKPGAEMWMGQIHFGIHFSTCFRGDILQTAALALEKWPCP